MEAPYWSGDTYRAILRSILSGAILDGLDLHTLKASLLDRLGVPDAVLCGSGSLALELALHACGVRAGDEVVLPAFCCTAVVPPIVALGATPVLADVGAELNLTVETVEAALTRHTKAVIVPHLFGNPAAIDRIVQLVQGRNIRIIDDAAQALGATIDGRAVGSFGDAGLVSFGAEKICFGLGGGAIISRRPDLMAEVNAATLVAPRCMPPLAGLLSTLFWRRWRRWTRPIERIVVRNEAQPDRPRSLYRRERMAHLSASVAVSLMGTLAINLARRRERVELYRELLSDIPGLDLICHQPGSACLTQVIRVEAFSRGEDMASRLIVALDAYGYEVRGSYVPIHLLPSFAGCVWDRLPWTERVWADLVELPCEPSVSLADVRKIAELIRRGIRGVR